MVPIVLYTRRAVLEKKSKNIPFEHLIPYNPGLRIFSEKPSGSKGGPYCPLSTCTKLGRSLEPLWRNGKKAKNTFFDTKLNPL